MDGYASNPGDLNWDALKQLGDVTVYPRTSDAEKVERAKDADIILINKVQMDAETIAKLPRLKYIGVQATGFNVVDIQAAKERGIVVTNIPAYSTDSVAQMTFALILAITNRVEHYTQENRNDRWAYNKDFCYWDTPLMELAGKKMGIMGLGNIGIKVATIARDMGMDVCACTSKNATDLPEWITKVSRDGLLATSDILSLHCPLNDDTYHLINDESIKKMKPSAILINTGRGPLVDEEAVAKALHEGRLAAYGADVMSQEPPRQDNPLFREPNAFIIPCSIYLLYQLSLAIFIGNTPSINYGIDIIGAVNTYLHGILTINLFPFSAISSSVSSIDSRLNLSHNTLYIQINRIIRSFFSIGSNVSCDDRSTFLHTIGNKGRITHHKVLVISGIELREDGSTLHIIQCLGTITELISIQ